MGEWLKERLDPFLKKIQVAKGLTRKGPQSSFFNLKNLCGCTI